MTDLPKKKKGKGKEREKKNEKEKQEEEKGLEWGKDEKKRNPSLNRNIQR